MKRTWTITGVADVPKSFAWYQKLFGQAPGALFHRDFAQALDDDGTVLLCLHEWGVGDPPPLTSPENGPPGNGLLLFFRVDDYDAALARARAQVPTFAQEPSVNRNTRAREFRSATPTATS